MEPLNPIREGYVTRFEEAPDPTRTQPCPALETDPYAMPSAPPPEVLDALDRAAQVLDELGRRNVSVWLDAAGGSSPLRVILLHRGGPVHELSHHALLNLLDGDTGVATAALT
jgi:hypothetical protein